MMVVADIEISFPLEDLQRLKKYCETNNIDIGNYACNAILDKMSKDLVA